MKNLYLIKVQIDATRKEPELQNLLGALRRLYPHPGLTSGLHIAYYAERVTISHVRVIQTDLLPWEVRDREYSSLTGITIAGRVTVHRLGLVGQAYKLEAKEEDE